MEYQQLPPVSMIIGTPNATHSSQVHNLNQNNGTNVQMQPSLLPLQVAHNLHQLTSHNNNQLNGIHHSVNNQNQTSQSLPPTAQLLQAIHNTQHQSSLQNIGTNNTNGTTINNTSSNDNNATNDDSNRWTQYQVQQLWRQHYLNGKGNNSWFLRLQHNEENHFRNEVFHSALH